MRTRFVPAALALAFVALAGPTLAQELQHNEGVIAERSGGPSENPLVLDRSTLGREYPTIGRALERPGAFTAAEDDEVASLRAFWERMMAHDGLRVDGVDWSISPAMPQGDLTAPDEAEKGAAGTTSSLGLVALVATVSAVAILSRRH